MVPDAFDFPILPYQFTMDNMKKLLPFLCLTLVLTACGPATTTNGQDGDSTAVKDSTPATDTMTPPPADSGSSTTPDDGGSTGGTDTPPADNGGNTGGRNANPNAPIGGKTFKVTGHILVQGQYCGGAAPSQQILDEAQRPRPMANQGFLIRGGGTNMLGKSMVTRTRTDANGNFSVDLAPGTYCMVLEEKESARQRGFYDNTNYVIDRKCDDKWLTTCDLSFTVADKPVSGLRLTFQKKCYIDNTLSPCVTWNGPLPPSAPKGGSR